MIHKTRDQIPTDSLLVLLAAPNAADHYPHIGFARHDSAWILSAAAPRLSNFEGTRR